MNRSLLLLGILAVTFVGCSVQQTDAGTQNNAANGSSDTTGSVIEADTDTTRPEIWRVYCCPPIVGVYEPADNGLCGLFFYRDWQDADDEYPAYVLATDGSCNGGLEANGDYCLDSLAIVPERFGPLHAALDSYRCTDRGWMWTFTLVDSLGISRASIRRDCNQKLHAVVDDLQINLPERVQVVTKRREEIGTME